MRDRSKSANVRGFDPYGIPCDGSLDPVLRDLDQMHCGLRSWRRGWRV